MSVVCMIAPRLTQNVGDLVPAEARAETFAAEWAGRERGAGIHEGAL